MGRNKKGYNWKARSNQSGKIDDTESKKLAGKVEIPSSLNDSNADNSGSNALVLPSKKRKFKADPNSGPVGRILSKKRRKHLEKIIDRKKKKEERGDLLAKLEQVQVDDKVLQHMTSLSSVQTKGLKRQFAEDEWLDKMKEDNVALERVVMAASEDVPEIAKKVRLKKPMKPDPAIDLKNDDPNVLGFGAESSSSEEEDDDSEIESENNAVEETKQEESESKIDEVNEIKSEKDVSKVEKPVKSEEPILIEETVHVPVNRTAEVNEARSKLPIVAEEHTIMDAIRHNDVVIIAGETGSGKTTQVPQFLYEAGFAAGDKMIGITEPRRVAAIAMANRVADEMNMPRNNVVSYQIRFDDKTKDSTRMKFMTDGVLLREVERDPYLRKYSAIIIDEAHERSVSTDILIGHLSRYVFKRNKSSKVAEFGRLKLIIMSATLRVEDFMPSPERKIQLFAKPPPLISVDGRQFDVQVHFNRKTPAEEGEYLNEAFRKVSKIHRTLPEGGILVFVTGQDEVRKLVKRLRQSFPTKIDNTVDDDEKNLDKVMVGMKKKNKRQKQKPAGLPKVNLDSYQVRPDLDEGNDIDFRGDDGEELENEDDAVLDDSIVDGEGAASLSEPLWVLPLYSKLDPGEQARIFRPTPGGHRLCVIATNVAETSLTIPGIKYVVDTGKMKVRLYDKVTGVSTYQVMWTSKAQADQRAGRAGRQGSGHCYRLYSSAVFQLFDDHARPDIRCRPVDDVVLQLKAMGKNNIDKFPFPSPPEEQQIKTAERHLVKLGALDPDSKKITPLGRTISMFPVAPRYGKMLALSHQHNLTEHTITMVAALSMQEVLLENPVGNHEDTFNKQEIGQIRSKWSGSGHTRLLGDPMVLLSAIYATEFAGCSRSFCDSVGLRFKAMQEIRKLRRQLANEISSLNVVLNPSTQPPEQTEAFLLRQILLSGLSDNVARKVSLDEIANSQDKKKMRFAYMTRTMEEPVFLNQTSVLRSQLPEWVVFQEVYEVQDKMYMRGVTAIEANWLPDFCPVDCNLSKPLADREPYLDEERGEVITICTGTFGERGWTLPLIPVTHPVASERYRFFAKFILEGKVLKPLEEFTNDLLSPPVSMIKTWGSLHAKRTKPLFETLVMNQVDTKAKLIKALSENSKFLKKEYLLWIKEEHHEQVNKLWPELLTK